MDNTYNCSIYDGKFKGTEDYETIRCTKSHYYH